MSKESKGYKNMPKKIYIRTFGCQMNDRDSEALLGLFLQEGYVQAQGVDEADVVLINTCSVRDHAENRAVSFAGSLKREGKKKIVGIIGCMARNRGEELFKKMPHVSLICGPAKLFNIPAYIEKIRNEHTRIIDLEDMGRDEGFYEASYRDESDHAQVVISTGCSNYCSYCVVPYVRGDLRLRRPLDIVEEIKRNTGLGIKRVTLLGQNVNDYLYEPEKIDFVGLLRMVAEIDGLEELGFVTSHPRNTSRALFEVMAQSNKIKKHLHLPFQSGSDRILEMMNRGYTKAHYLQLLDDYKAIVGGLLSTDIIVGFPTESEGDFLQTKHVLEQAQFRYAYIFKYSPRPNTKAQGVADDVAQATKEARHKVLLDLQKEISRNSSHV